MREYEIWHDEYRGDDTKNEYWHGILFIPLDKKQEITELLKKIRDEHKIPYDKDIKFAGVLKNGNKQQGKIINNNLSFFFLNIC